MKRLLAIAIMIMAVAHEALCDYSGGELSFTHYTTDNGLPSNRVRDIVQDGEGFMWFATDAGLVRYDGTSSRVFSPGEDSSPSEETFILSICRHGDGLLVGTDQALYRYDPARERMELMKLTYAPGVKRRVEGSVRDICVDKAGTIWLSVDGNGIFSMTADGKVMANHRFDQYQNFIGMLHVDSNGSVWAVSNSGRGALLKYDRNKGNFETFALKNDGQTVSYRALAITSDESGMFWLGTWEEGLVRFNGRTGECHPVATLTPPDVWHIHSVTFFTPTILLVGCDSGLVSVDITTGEWKVYQEDELNPDSLNDRFVYPVTIDSDGGLWVGTFYRGVNYQSRGAKRFKRWRHSRFANSVSGNVVIRLCEDNSGFIWIGTADGGLCRYDPGNGTFRKYPLTDCYTNDNINALCADNGRLWIGTYTKGVGIMDMSSGKWERIPIEGSGSDSNSCYAICKDSGGRIWAGMTETFACYNATRGVMESVRKLNAWINDIDEDREGRLWIATQGDGLYRYDPKTGNWKGYKASGTPGSLPHNHVNNVNIDSEGKVYVATTGGVYVFDSESESFDKVDAGMTIAAAHSVEVVGGEKWIGTSSGLLYVCSGGMSRLYTTADGISDNQFVPGASLQTSDGKIYYGTVNGLCMVDPLEARSLMPEPKVRFTALDIINTPVEVGDPRLPTSLNRLEELVLTHADHTFSVYFSALNYSNPAGSVYKYRLEGFDKTWIEAGKENRATYSNLPPGTYTLRVKAANADGIWGGESVALRIVVRPAWYASAVMKAFYVLLGMTLLLWGVRLIVRRMERNHIIELDRISSNKEKEMYRSKLSFFTVVAHEIRTPVSLIIGPLEKILNSKDKFTPALRDDLDIINRNARRLLSLVNQLLDFRKVEDNALPIGFRTVRIAPLVESVADRFRPSVEHKGGELTLSLPDRDFTADVDTEALTKLVSNLINNARKFTKDHIRVECRPLPDGKNFMISVADNGIGISRENRDKVFKPFFQVLDNINESKGGTGLGLAIVKSVADAHGGSVDLSSSPGRGATFTVTLPLHQDSLIPEEPSSGGDDAGKEESRSQGHPSDCGDGRPVLLVVDDNEEMVRFIVSNFEPEYDVVTAGNGKEALARMRERQVSLIICDWMMPVMDGVEFLKAVRNNENYSHIPFVMLTAKTDNVSKIETMRSGADAYVEKPFSIAFLEARITNLLDMRSMLRKKYSRSPLEPIATLAPSPLDNELLVEIQKLIEENFSNPNLNVDFLVEHIGISRSGLYAKIRTLADVSPNELIQITRLKKAAELLKDGTRRVSEVSFMVGFSSTSYFTRCFHKQFGMKPNDFQAEFQGNNQSGEATSAKPSPDSAGQ